MSFTRLFIPQNDSVPQGNSAQDNAAQDSAAQKKRKKREEARRKRKEEQEARKKKRLEEQAKKDSLAKVNAAAVKIVPQHKDTLRDTSTAAQSLFTGHELRPRTLEPVPHEASRSLWLFALLFTAYAIYVSLRVIYSKRFRQEVSAFFTSRAISQMMREEYAISNRVSIGLTALFIMLFSLFLYQVFAYFGYFGAENFTGPQFFIRICGVVVVMFALKLLLLRILGVVFMVEAAVNEYIFNIFLHHKALGMFLFPVTIALAFLRDISPRFLIVTGWSIIGLVLVYRTIRIIFGGFQTGSISKYYLFLYLCTLEILPLIVIIKVFISQT